MCKKAALKIYPKNYTLKRHTFHLCAFKMCTNIKVTNNFSSIKWTIKEVRQGWVSEKKSQGEQPSTDQGAAQT